MPCFHTCFVITFCAPIVYHTSCSILALEKDKEEHTCHSHKSLQDCIPSIHSLGPNVHGSFPEDHYSPRYTSSPNNTSSQYR
ncbi:hypothetical protein EDD15DRAFT_1010921 [Pisolithus albus]|nr:hypothetical protein EDD15DRAFT_1010921 [Pisolithus albus]